MGGRKSTLATSVLAVEIVTKLVCPCSIPDGANYELSYHTSYYDALY